MIKHIVLAGIPQLREIAEPVSADMFQSVALNTIIADLFETMKAYKGVGIAATQIGVSLRVLAYGFDFNHPRYPEQDPIPLCLMINPEIITKSKEIVYLFEGCLSLPEVRGLVPRHEWIEVKYQNEHGQVMQKRHSGFEARIIQHEIDHLDGKLYPERMDNMRTLGITAALRESGIIR
ncbi:MAG: peptide deformylase [Proteobacteria bacterium]|nr:peptide deformylase [Pseudomonadota bacterium]